MDLDHLEKRILRVLDRIEEIIERCQLRPRRDTRILTAFGPQGVEIMSGTLNPGQTKTLTVAFTDTAVPPVAHPLSALPTCVDPTGTLVTTPVSTTGSPPAITDPTFAWSIAAPASAAVGASLPVTLSGTNPDGTIDTEPYPISIAAVDDTAIQINSFA
jgi:hypothetical protein